MRNYLTDPSIPRGLLALVTAAIGIPMHSQALPRDPAHPLNLTVEHDRSRVIVRVHACADPPTRVRYELLVEGASRTRHVAATTAGPHDQVISQVLFGENERWTARLIVHLPGGDDYELTAQSSS